MFREKSSIDEEEIEVKEENKEDKTNNTFH